MPFSEKDKSKIKMVSLAAKKEDKVVWYSPIDQNKKPELTIIQGMYNRFCRQPKFQFANVIQFYEYPYANENLIAVMKKNQSI